MRAVQWRRMVLEAMTWLVSLFIKVYMMTLRIYVDRRLERKCFRCGESFVAAFWHGHMLLPLFVYRNLSAAVLVSRSRDGERIAQVARHFGIGSVRGSTSRGAVTAMRALFDVARQGTIHVALTPDGPRGPRHRVAPGVVYLAQKSGLPILPLAVGLDRYWVLPSKWDEFLLPKPFARGLIRVDDLFWVPAELSAEELEQYRLQLEKRMQTLARATYAEAKQADLATDPTLSVAH